jgi:hypothetical protein
MLAEVKLGDIQPFARYSIAEIDGKMYVIEENASYSRSILGEIVDIINSRDIDAYEEYRKQGYWGLKLRNSERMLILKPLTIEEKRKLYKSKAAETG